VRYGSESLVGKDQYDLRENLSRQYNWWSFYALSKHERVSESSGENRSHGSGIV
jgi:hypothetical protein